MMQKKDPAPVSRKRSRSPAGSSQSSKKQDCTCQADHSNGNTFLQVDKIVEDLKKEHGATYSVEQLRTWGHLIQMGKHESMTVPLTSPSRLVRPQVKNLSQELVIHQVN